MLVDAAGLTGTIGGGRLEWEATEAARDLLRQGRRAARLMNRVLGIDLGQCCGGVVAVWLECFPQASLPQLQQLNAQAVGSPLVLATATAADGVRQELRSGNFSDENVTRLLALPRQQAAPLALRTGDGEITFFERLDEDFPAVWLYGAGHVGQALAGMLVQLPLRLCWLDSRAGQIPQGAAGYSRFLPAAELVESVAEASPGSYFLVMTHDHGLDYELCRAVLMRKDLCWLGLIGSQSKGARFRSRLRRDGFRNDAIGRLVCPIGVEGVKSKWPAAIAVAIAAQLMQMLSRPIHAARAPTIPAAVEACAAGNCETCGGHKKIADGKAVART
jgi:xanthine dehydrogenase accessory factor